MKKIFYYVLFFSFVTGALGSVFAKGKKKHKKLLAPIDYCKKTDAVCVGKVLLKEIKRKTREIKPEILSFYSNRSCSKRFLEQVRILRGSYLQKKKQCRRGDMAGSYFYSIYVASIKRCLTLKQPALWFKKICNMIGY